MEVFPGGHFFGQEQRPQLIAALRRRLLDLRL
jgi:surfactin synthase thioesterase subunit